MYLSCKLDSLASGALFRPWSVDAHSAVPAFDNLEELCLPAMRQDLKRIHCPPLTNQGAGPRVGLLSMLPLTILSSSKLKHSTDPALPSGCSACCGSRRCPPAEQTGTTCHLHSNTASLAGASVSRTSHQAPFFAPSPGEVELPCARRPPK